MADIFISYSKQDPEYTEALAGDLEARGYTTWWDTSLLPGDEFPEEIKRQIDVAKAVIVIWTPNSVQSEWVRAEATLALVQDKLLTVFAPGLDFTKIPLPFNTRHCEPISNRGQILAAVEIKFKGGTRDSVAVVEDAESFFQKARNYERGEYGFPKDLGFARDYYKRAANLSHMESMIKYWLITKDFDFNDAQFYLRKAVDLGHRQAFIWLAAFDYEYCLTKAKKSNNTDQLIDIALSHYHNKDNYVYCLEAAAALNNTLAMMILGDHYRMYYDDPETCLKWYKRAVDLGDTEACNRIANMFATGNKIAYSPEDARYWYQKAADLGDESAKKYLKSLKR